MFRFTRIYQIFFLLFFLNSFAQTKLPSFFGDHMILQQQTDAAIWGQDDPGTQIVISTNWGSDNTTIADSTGAWRTTLKTPEAGGPYEIKVQGSEVVMFKNVLIGEVWICSGQSNMQMSLKGYYGQPINGGNDAILESKNPMIRLFNTTRNASLVPLNDVEGSWAEAAPGTAADFSATAYFFGKRLYDILGVPIGLIHTSWGSANSETWMNAKSLSEFENIEIPKAIPDRLPQQGPSLLYNAMLHPFIGYAIKGAIWYQGESNRLRAEEYKKIFPAMISNWRVDWNQGDFPFYFVQIAPFNYGNSNAAFLREAQLFTMNTVPNTGMVVTQDIGECNDIHPKEKKIVGDRLALWALAKDYKLSGFGFSGPVYKSMEQKHNEIIISFDYAELGLSSYRQALDGFEIAGNDRKFIPAKAKIVRGKIVVWSDEIVKPEAVRYAFKNCGIGNLYNVSGLPASSFRTDSWKPESKTSN